MDTLMYASELNTFKSRILNKRVIHVSEYYNVSQALDL